SLTNHFRDEFLSDWQTPALLGWSVEASAEREPGSGSLVDWRVQDGALQQSSATQGEHIVLKGPAHEHYECGVTMMLLRANEHGQPALGLVAWHSLEEKLLVRLVCSQSCWTLAVESRGSTPQASASLDLPRSFDPYDRHTLRLRRWGDQLTIYLD